MATGGNWNAPNPYFSNAKSYGWGDLSFPSTPIAKEYVQTQPGVAFTRATAGYAGGLNPYARFVQGQESRAEDAYKAAVTQNPNLTRQSFFAGLEPIFRQMFQNLGPRGRGEQRGLYAPNARWQRWG